MTTPLSARAILDDLADRSGVMRTPCGDGDMVWRIWGPGDSTKPALVLLHGGFGAWNHWVRTIPHFAGNRTVVVPDLPGCGMSADPSEPYDADSLAQLIADGLDRAIPGDAPFDLVGFSFGGLLGGPIARRQASRIRRLVIVGTPILGLTTKGPANDLLPVPDGLSPDEAAPIYRANLEKLMVHAPEAIDALAMTLHTENMARSRLRSRGIARRTIAADSLREPLCPLAFIYGDRDVTLDPDLDGIRACAHTLDRDAPFHVLPDIGHWVQYEAAERFNPLLAQILDAAAQPTFAIIDDQC